MVGRRGRTLVFVAGLAAVVALQGCVLVDRNREPEDWQMFWMGLDMAVISLILSWLVIGFSRYCSNRFVISRKDFQALMEARKAATSGAAKPAGEKTPVEFAVEQSEDTEDDRPTVIRPPVGKVNFKETRLNLGKRSVQTSLLLAFFVAILFFGFLTAIDYMMSFRIAKMEDPVKVRGGGEGIEAVRPWRAVPLEPIKIPYRTKSPTQALFHTWGLSLVFRNHAYHGMFVNSGAMFKIAWLVDYIPLLAKLDAMGYLNYFLSFLCFFLVAYIGARRTKSLWFFPLVLCLLNVVLTMCAYYLGWYGEISEIFRLDRELGPLLDAGLPL